MKVYFHFNIDGFSNCYVVTNEKTMEALIIDPGKITKEILEQIENGPFDLTAVLITTKAFFGPGTLPFTKIILFSRSILTISRF